MERGKEGGREGRRGVRVTPLSLLEVGVEQSWSQV